MKSEKILVENAEMSQITAQLIKTNVYFTAGTHSIYVPSQGRKYMNRRSSHLWPNLEGVYEYMTPGEAARTELSREFPDIKRVGWRKGHIALFDKRQPQAFFGEYRGDMVYIDLVGAYHQIYKYLWLDVAFPRGLGGKYPLAEVAYRLKDWKAARNAVIGVTYSRQIVGIKGNSRKQMRIPNKFLSPCLWASVQGILHFVAATAIDMGAIYVNTDGYILPMNKFDDFFETITMHGFVASVRAIGDGHIRGWNCYSVGKYSTKVYSLDLPYSTKEFSNVDETKQGEWRKYWRRVRYTFRSSKYPKSD